MTELDHPITHSKVIGNCKLIELAAEKCNFSLHGRVSAGALQSGGLAAMQQRVMMTEASVVMVTADLILLINRLSKLIALSLPIEGGGEEFNPRYDLESVTKQINETENLRSEWISFFCDYSYSSNSKSPVHGGPIIVYGKERQTLWDDFDEAMSLFVIGHEYGHHIAKHSLGDQVSVDGMNTESQHQDELVADMLATVLSTSAGQLAERPNWFALSGVGAVIILTVLEYIRRGERILNTGSHESTITRNSHPPLDGRLKVVRNVVSDFFGDKGAETAIRMQNHIKELIDLAWFYASEELINAHHRGVRPKRRISNGYNNAIGTYQKYLASNPNFTMAKVSLLPWQTFRPDQICSGTWSLPDIQHQW
jgi:hypothetical protein